MEIAITPAGFSTHKSGTTGAPGTFTGLASAFNVLIDAHVPTRILPGAFTKTIVENRHRIKVLYQHSEYDPIGVPLSMVETAEGLLVTAKLAQTDKGREVGQLIKDGVLTELSIGFDTVTSEDVDEGALGRVRHIREVRLWEFSPVTFGANRGARITGAHRRGLPGPATIEARVLDLQIQMLELDQRQLQRKTTFERQLDDLQATASRLGR